MKDSFALFSHIKEAIDKIENYTKGGKTEFLEKPIIQDAVIRNLEIIGEAVKGIDDRVRAEYPSIPWKSIAGMRDFLIHVYFGINLQIVWKTISDDLPPLKKAVEDYLDRDENMPTN